MKTITNKRVVLAATWRVSLTNIRGMKTSKK